MYEKQLEFMIEAAKEARKIILDVYHSSSMGVEIKEDKSPVTIADKAADKKIREILHKAFPNYAFLTEESDDDYSRLDNDYVFIVDPVDGTKDFIARDGGFTTNIALAYKHEVVVGVVSIPVSGEIYYGVKNQGSFYLKENEKPIQIHVSDKIKDLTCLTSVFHLNEKEIDAIKRHSDLIKHVQKKGSSLKACEIARGNAEISYRYSSGTKEWDTAASQIIVEEAGGLFIKPNGERILYNRKDVYNREGYIIVNRKENILL